MAVHATVYGLVFQEIDPLDPTSRMHCPMPPLMLAPHGPQLKTEPSRRGATIVVACWERVNERDIERERKRERGTDGQTNEQGPVYGDGVARMTAIAECRGKLGYAGVSVCAAQVEHAADETDDGHMLKLNAVSV